MPLNLSELDQQIQFLASKRLSDSFKASSTLQACWEAFWRWEGQENQLREILDISLEENPLNRIAAPYFEPITTTYPTPPLPLGAQLIAVDGSQYASNTLHCGLINTAVYSYPYGGSDIPTVNIHTKVIWQNGYNNGGFFAEDLVEFSRDVDERHNIVEYVMRSSNPTTLGVVDGPIEIWRPKGVIHWAEYRRRVENYLEGLDRLRDKQAIYAGYVDSPVGCPVVRMLETADAWGRSLDADVFNKHFPGVSDIELFGRLLKPGERSAVFQIAANPTSPFQGARTLCFFYLNIGNIAQPMLARIEVPAWVADDSKRLNILHAILFHQSGLVEDFHYPFALFRAHEEACVGLSERNLFDQMLTSELWRIGATDYFPTPKALYKRFA